MLRPKAIEVKALNDYKIFVIFNNGEKKVFNLKNKLHHPFYADLIDEEIFKSVHTNGYTVEWDGEIDICPDELYNDSIPYDEAI